MPTSNDTRAVLLLGLGLLLLVGLLVWHDVTQRRACEARGGTYFSPRGDSLCLAPGQVLR